MIQKPKGTKNLGDKPSNPKRKSKASTIAPFVFMEPKTEYEKGDKVGPLLSDLLGFSGQAHRFHLNTRSYARHKALDELYSDLPEKVDQLAECYLAKPENEIMTLTNKSFDTPEEMLEFVIDYTNKAGDVGCRAMNNALDDLTMFAQQVLYKLTHLH